jgi:hypothetical protein
MPLAAHTRVDPVLSVTTSRSVRARPQHDDGQPDQPEGVRLKQRGHGFGRLRGDQGPGRGEADP